MNLANTTQTATAASRQRVVLVDTPQRWIRQPADLVAAIIALLALAGVIMLSLYASSTVAGVTSDVRAATASVAAKIFFIPINTLEGIVSFFLPLALLANLAIYRRWRTLITALVATIFTGALSVTWQYVFYKVLGSTTHPGTPLHAIAQALPYLVVIATLLTLTGTFANNVLVRWGWILTGIVALLLVLQGKYTLPALVISLLLGVAIACLARFIIGTVPQRVTGSDIVDLVKRAGIDPANIIRSDIEPDDDAVAWEITTSQPLGYVDSSTTKRLLSSLSSNVSDSLSTSDAGSTSTPKTTSSRKTDIDAAAKIRETKEAYPRVQPTSVSRTYLVKDTAGTDYQIYVLDEDRIIVSALNELWQQLRLKVNYHDNASTLSGAGNHHVLMQLEAEKHEVTPAQLVSHAHHKSSICIVYRVSSALPLEKIPAENISDADLDSFWDTLQRAHSHGMSHGNIHAQSVSFDDDGLHIHHWQTGSIMASETVRLVDLAQGLAMLAGIVGTERAIDSLRRAIAFERIMSLVPLLQKTVMPPRTRQDFPKAKDFQQLRHELEEHLPDGDTIEPIELKRFSPKTILTVSVGVIAIYLLAASVNFKELSHAISHANPMWMVLSFAAGLVTYLGSALTLKAYTQERVPLGQATLIQVAASLVTLVAPAGIGPAALNLRFLQKKNVGTAPAVATVTVVQLAQFVTTVFTLLILTLVTGEFGTLSLPSISAVVWVVLGIAAIGAVFLIKPLRRWILAKIEPTIKQIWPRLVWLGTHPQRLALGFLGSVIITVSFVACFGFALAAFGYQLPIVTLAVTYLISNSVGSLVPSPGGIGPVEAALTGGLALTGIPYSVALSTAVLYRLFTFWGRVPLGWIALRIATKRNYI